MEEIGIVTLTPEQIENMCEVAEKAARKHILFEVPLHRIYDIDMTIDIKGLKPITVNVDLKITLSPIMKDYDVQKLANEANKKAFLAIEKNFSELTCKLEENALV